MQNIVANASKCTSRVLEGCSSRRTRKRRRGRSAFCAAAAAFFVAAPPLAQAQAQAQAEEKARATMEHFRTQLDRAEKERDEAREFGSESFRQVQALEKKLSEASAFFNGLKNGNHLTSAGR